MERDEWSLYHIIKKVLAYCKPFKLDVYKARALDEVTTTTSSEKIDRFLEGDELILSPQTSRETHLSMVNKNGRDSYRDQERTSKSWKVIDLFAICI